MNVIDSQHHGSCTTSIGNAIDLDEVLLHEFGHGLGLSHDLVPGNTKPTLLTSSTSFWNNVTL